MYYDLGSNIELYVYEYCGEILIDKEVHTSILSNNYHIVIEFIDKRSVKLFLSQPDQKPPHINVYLVVQLHSRCKTHA